jgi:hypothetical protein
MCTVGLFLLNDKDMWYISAGKSQESIMASLSEAQADLQAKLWFKIEGLEGQPACPQVDGSPLQAQHFSLFTPWWRIRSVAALQIGFNIR